jgi:hypothetical protein
MIVPQDFDVNSQKGVLEAKRIQVPLILAWALSIHKGKEVASGPLLHIMSDSEVFLFQLKVLLFQD